MSNAAVNQVKACEAYPARVSDSVLLLTLQFTMHASHNIDVRVAACSGTVQLVA